MDCINADTIESVIRDDIVSKNLSIQKCRGQYNGSYSTMACCRGDVN